MHRLFAIPIVAASIVACGQAVSPATPSAGTPSRSPAVVVATQQPASDLAPTDATAPTPDGSIVFMREGADGRFQTWTACVDLSNAVQLTSTPDTEAGWPVWSPDGTRIAFNANFDDPDRSDGLDIWDIYTMAADGGDVVRLTRSPGLYGDPGYSLDGSLIAFDSTVIGSEGIYVMSAVDGSGIRRVTGLPEGVVTTFAPRFAPDGSEIVFLGEFNDHSGALYVIGLDGAGLRRITPDAVYPEKAAWSPDGARIAFDARSSGFPFQSLWTVEPNGAGLTHLMDGFRGAAGVEHGFSAPVWAPDGSMLLAVHGRHAADGSVTTTLSTIRPDASDLRDVTDGKHGEAFKPDWRAAAC